MSTARLQEPAHLTALAIALSAVGLEVEARYGHEPPYLHITNPALTCAGRRVGALLNERVTARPGDGGWYFHWSWGDPLCRVTDLDTAAERIGHVLSGPEDAHT